MSQHLNNKGKDASKKYASFNINQTYKGSKGDNKSAQGNRSHGLQSLGKVQTRRITPATLPSLKSENLGNDPRVPLVPSGGSGGWGKKEPTSSQKLSDTSSPPSGQGKQTQAAGKHGDNQEISLRPNAGAVPGGKSGEGAKTWVNKQVNSSQKSDSPYFQKEFPTLGKEDLNKDPDKKDQSEEGEPNVNLQAMAHQQALNGQKWMENTSMPPPNMPFHGERPMYNGNQMPPFPYVFPGSRMPMHPYPYFPYPGGKMPFDTNYMQQMPFMNQSTSKSERPSTVKDSDLKELDQDKDESGWDAAQDEVDYNAKLTFDESDESDSDNVPDKKNKEKDSGPKEKSANQKEKDQRSWPAGYPNFPPQMMNWSRMQFPQGYEPPRGAQPPGPHGYPIHPMFFMPYGITPNMQQHMQQQANKEKQEEKFLSNIDSTEKEKFAMKDDKSENERRAAAKADKQSKLKSAEEKMKQRELEKLKQKELQIEDLEETKRESGDSLRALPRSRNDSEASDSSRRSSKEVPPRFQRKRSSQNEFNIEEDIEQTSDGPQMRIMKRKESTESQMEELKTIPTKLETKETFNDTQYKIDTQEKPPTRQASEKRTSRAPPKGELKDLSESRREKEEKTSKRDHFDGDRPKRSESRSSSSQRFSDTKLAKGNKKASRDENADTSNFKSSHDKGKVSDKPSPWNKGLSAKEHDRQSKTTKFAEIQKEEEEESRKQELSVDVKKEFSESASKMIPPVGERQSPDENKFRSDKVERYRSNKPRRLDSAKMDGVDKPRRTERLDRLERTERFEKRRYDDNKNERYGDRRREEPSRKDKRDDRRDNCDYQNQPKKDFREDRRDRGEKRDRPPRKDYEKPTRDRRFDKPGEEKRNQKSDVQRNQKVEKQDGVESKSFHEGKKFDKDSRPHRERDRRYNDRDNKKYNDRDNRERRYERDDGEKRFNERKQRDDNRSERRRNDERQNRQDWSKQTVKKNDETVKASPSNKRSETISEINALFTSIDENKVKENESGKLQNTTVEDSKVKEEKTQPVEVTKEGKEMSKEVRQFKPEAGFGLPVKRDDGRKSDRYERRGERRDRNYESRGEFSQRGRGRGSRRGSGDYHYSRVQKATEDVSSGEVSGTEDDKKKSIKPLKKGRPQKWDDTPPRFRQQTSRGRGGSNARGRGRGRGTSTERYRSEKKKEESKIDDETFFSAEESQGSHSSEEKEDKDGKQKQNYERKSRPTPSSQPREKRESLDFKRSRGSGRGLLRGARNGSFLVNRQQVGEKDVLRKGGENTLPAAEENIGSKNNVLQSATTIEENSTHSPPKKSKTVAEKREEKKRDISREFDLNNIASVVCIDDMLTIQEQLTDKASDDGFVMVTSKKHQKEQRDRAREEEKKKQKKEANIAANKQQKDRTTGNRRETSKDQTNTSKGNKQTTEATVPTSSNDQLSAVSTSVSTSVTISTTTTVAAPASNAAMAAIGGWEPAQSLMRTSQSSALEPNKSIVTNVNAWQRPLTLASSAPDPRAVGTGKPSSSQASSLKATVVPPQPTPESASPLVTPPALTPIGSTSAPLPPSNIVPIKAVSSEKTVKSDILPKGKEDDGKQVLTKANVQPKKELGDRSEKRRGNADKTTDGKKEPKTASKRSSRSDKPPRFQTTSKKDSGGTEGRSARNSEKKHGGYDKERKDARDENKSRKRTADRQRKNDYSKDSNRDSNKTSSDRQSKQPPVSNNNPKPSNDVLTNTVASANTSSKSILSDADKVVGSKKPLLKSQSSVGSYTAPSGYSTAAEEEVVEIQLQSETFKEPFVLSQSQDDEHNANQTARSVIKSLNDEEEKSLETRSLPGTPPPLVVKIPEPTLSGPSSDPGRTPSPTNKGQAPSMDHEMNEMNRKLFNTRKVWESTPSDNQVAVVSSITVTSSSEENAVPVSIIDTKQPASPTKSLPDTVPISSAADLSKSAEEKPSIAPGFSSVPKRSEQQICKVKPQQQQPAHNEDAARLNQAKVSIDRTINVPSPLSTSKYASYTLPNRHNTLYANTESAYGEPFRSPNNQFASLGNQVRSSPHSASTIAQHQRDAMLSLQLGNLYGTSNPLLTWQMIPSSSIPQATPQASQQQPKTVAYPAPNASLFTSQSPLTSNQLLMQYDTNFDLQRSSTPLQRQPVNILPLHQQQQQQQTQQHAVSQTNALVGMIPTTAALNPSQRPLRKDQLYRNLNPESAQNMAFLLNHNTVLQQHLAAQQAQNTDLTKHVNAKPFEPTTQAQAPLIQSQPVMQPTMPIAQQQQLVNTIYRPSSAANAPRQVQNINRQQMLPTQQRQNIPSSMRHQPNQLIASVRPRPVQPMNHPNSISRSQMNVSDRMAGMTIQYPKNNMQPSLPNSRRQGPIGQVANLSSQALPNPYVHTSGMQQRTNPRNLNMPSLPGPIQRPSQSDQVHHMNYASLQPKQTQAVQQQQQPIVQQSPIVNDSGDFKKIQRQKMLEDTKKYFQEQQQQQHNTTSISPEKENLGEEALSNRSTAITEKKVVYNENDVGKQIKDSHSVSKVSSSKTVTAADRNVRNTKQRQSSGNDMKKKRDGPPPQHTRRNVPSKV